MANKIGVYEVVCKVNGRKIVGSAQDIKKRWSYYKTKLKNGEFSNKELQSDYNKFGLDNFDFIIIEECQSVEGLPLLEQQWIDYYWDSGILYNRNRVKKTEKHIRTGEEAANYKRKRSELNSGENNPMHSGKLLIDDVMQIKLLIDDGLKNREIIKQYEDKTTSQMISQIRRGTRYKNVIPYRAPQEG